MIRASNACLVTGLLAVLMVITVGCSATEPEQPAAPVDDTWVLELLNGRTLVKGSAITLRIDGNHLDGFDGCNRYGWRNEAGENLIAGEDGMFEVPGFDRTDRNSA